MKKKSTMSNKNVSGQRNGLKIGIKFGSSAKMHADPHGYLSSQHLKKPASHS
jgi:hypothetical protein